MSIMPYVSSFIIHGVFCLSLLTESHSSTVVRYRTNLGFFGGYSTNHRSVLYSNSELDDWKNLTQLAHDGGLEQKALLCGLGSGAWLAYPEADYQIANNGNNYALLLIGDACVPADNINSVQAISPINKEPTGLITFTEAQFASEALWITNETKTASGVKSFICPSDLSGEWTVEGDGKKVCIVRPKDLIATGVCIFPDLSTQLSMQSATITIGCPDFPGKELFKTTDMPDDDLEGADNVTVNPIDMDGTKIVLLQTCFGSYGAYKIVDNYLPLPQITAICQDNTDQAHKIGFFKIIDAWKFRMSPDRQAEINPADIDSKRQDQNTPSRMRLLMSFFQIFKAGCPNVPEVYFNLLRYLFMQHLKTVWEEVPTVVQDLSNSTLSWKAAAEFLESCYQIRLIDPVPKIPEELQCIDSERYEDHDDDDWEESALDLFLSGDNLDHVIEQVWLMLNYVSPYCATVKRFKDNFWTEFTNLFRRNFLLPVLQQWMHPGTWQVYYDYMFSGFSIQREKRQIISCLQDILLRTPIADPVDRPSTNVKEFVNLSKKKSPIEIKEADTQKSDAKSRKKRSPGPKQHLTALQLIRKERLMIEGESEHGGEHKARRMSHGR